MRPNDMRAAADALDVLVRDAARAYFAMHDCPERRWLGAALSPYHDMVRHFHENDGPSR